MPLNAKALRDWTFEPRQQTYTDRETMLYALSLGFGADPLDKRELPFVYENELRAVPTMAAVLCHPGPWLTDPRTGATRSKTVHGEQRLRFHAPLPAAGRVVAAHLGNGASLCAMRDCRSVDTTMGFTALDGLVMGTRCGTIDPGVILHFQLRMGMSAADVEDMLYRQSGLLGVSGLSSDMRALAASDAPEAEEAMALFAWRAARETAALASSMGGLDGIVFTAGIGENDAAMRQRICARLAWLGVELDEQANAAGAPLVSTPGSHVAVRVIPTDEERMIALHTLHVLGENPS